MLDHLNRTKNIETPQIEVPLDGEVSGPGTFSFQITFDPTPSKLYQFEISYGPNGLLLGRSAVELLGQ